MMVTSKQHDTTSMTIMNTPTKKNRTTTRTPMTDVTTPYSSTSTATTNNNMTSPITSPPLISRRSSSTKKLMKPINLFPHRKKKITTKPKHSDGCSYSHNNSHDQKTNVRVGIRIRPFTAISSSSSSTTNSNNVTTTTTSPRQKQQSNGQSSSSREKTTTTNNRHTTSSTTSPRTSTTARPNHGTSSRQNNNSRPPLRSSSSSVIKKPNYTRLWAKTLAKSGLQKTKEFFSSSNKSNDNNKSSAWEVTNNNTTITLSSSSSSHLMTTRRQKEQYTFDAVYDQSSRTSELYETMMKPVVMKTMQHDGDDGGGHHGWILVYGQTGTGKTYTMQGPSSPPSHKRMATTTSRPPPTKKRDTKTKPSPNTKSKTKQPSKKTITRDNEGGLITLAMNDVFHVIKKHEHCRDYLLRLSYFEIYNERIYDLLADTNKTSTSITKNVGLPMYDTADDINDDDAGADVIIPGLSEHIVTTPSQVLHHLHHGQSQRSTGATERNKRSSRSHVILKLIIESQSKHSKNKVQVSTLQFIDLAGSECLKPTTLHDKTTRVEGHYINKSLLALGNVISKLSSSREEPQQQQQHIPYRDSKLTRLLRPNVITGHDTTIGIVFCISPEGGDVEESLGTLNYARRAKAIKQQTKPKPMKDDDNNNTLLKEYWNDVCDLKKEWNDIQELRRLEKIEKIQLLKKYRRHGGSSSSCYPARQLSLDESVHDEDIMAIEGQIRDLERLIINATATSFDDGDDGEIRDDVSSNNMTKTGASVNSSIHNNSGCRSRYNDDNRKNLHDDTTSHYFRQSPSSVIFHETTITTPPPPPPPPPARHFTKHQLTTSPGGGHSTPSLSEDEDTTSANDENNENFDCNNNNNNDGGIMLTPTMTHHQITKKEQPSSPLSTNAHHTTNYHDRRDNHHHHHHPISTTNRDDTVWDQLSQLKSMVHRSLNNNGIIVTEDSSNDNKVVKSSLAITNKTTTTTTTIPQQRRLPVITNQHGDSNASGSHVSLQNVMTNDQINEMNSLMNDVISFVKTSERQQDELKQDNKLMRDELNHDRRRLHDLEMEKKRVLLLLQQQRQIIEEDDDM